MMVQWVLATLASVSIFLCFIGLLLLPVNANTEGDALNALKTTLADPNNVLQSWDPTLVNPCTWFHVTCNSDNRVTRVDLGNANLSGPLVPQLGQLSNLQYLELYSNNIIGRIPSELGNLRNLVSLDLYLNKLVGPIPDTLGKLQKLRFLRLNNNSLSGHIPMSLTTITSLQVLDLSNNHLTGPIPVNGSFSRFTPISFANNQLDTPPAAPPPPISPTPTSPDCIALCKVRCKLHSKKKRVVCIRACTSCCLRCRCVPPGQYGNREKCGKCYANMTTRGGRLKCP